MRKEQGLATTGKRINFLSFSFAIIIIIIISVSFCFFFSSLQLNTSRLAQVIHFQKPKTLIRHCSETKENGQCNRGVEREKKEEKKNRGGEEGKKLCVVVVVAQSDIGSSKLYLSLSLCPFRHAFFSRAGPAPASARDKGDSLSPLRSRKTETNDGGGRC